MNEAELLSWAKQTQNEIMSNHFDLTRTSPEVFEDLVFLLRYLIQRINKLEGV